MCWCAHEITSLWCIWLSFPVWTPADIILLSSLLPFKNIEKWVFCNNNNNNKSNILSGFDWTLRDGPSGYAYWWVRPMNCNLTSHGTVIRGGGISVALCGLLIGNRKAPGFGLSSPPPLCRHRTHLMPQGGRRVWPNKCSSSSSHFGVFDTKGPSQGQSWEMAKKTDDLYADPIPLRGPFNPKK